MNANHEFDQRWAGTGMISERDGTGKQNNKQNVKFSPVRLPKNPWAGSTI